MPFITRCGKWNCAVRKNSSGLGDAPVSVAERARDRLRSEARFGPFWKVRRHHARGATTDRTDETKNPYAPRAVEHVHAAEALADDERVQPANGLMPDRRVLDRHRPLSLFLAVLRASAAGIAPRPRVRTGRRCRAGSSMRTSTRAINRAAARSPRRPRPRNISPSRRRNGSPKKPASSRRSGARSSSTPRTRAETTPLGQGPVYALKACTLVDLRAGIKPSRARIACRSEASTGSTPSM